MPKAIKFPEWVNKLPALVRLFTSEPDSALSRQALTSFGVHLKTTKLTTRWICDKLNGLDAKPFEGKKKPLGNADVIMSIEFDIRETESGTCRYSMSHRYTGEMGIPISIIEQGEDSIKDYIWENYASYEDVDYDANEEHSDYNSGETDVTQSDYDIDGLLERYHAEHPEEEDEE